MQFRKRSPEFISIFIFLAHIARHQSRIHRYIAHHIHVRSVSVNFAISLSFALPYKM
jgi:hypothetical protein